MTDTPALTVYYDAACPLCRREVAWYQRLDRAGRIAWADVAASADTLAAQGISQADALARIHARWPDGRLISGAAVFVAIWRHLPGFRLIAPVAAWKPVLAVLERGYVWFARRRGRLTGRACDTHGCAPE
jgi:predicted DCC family thiol-disulfide oxidoreductase YuxK